MADRYDVIVIGSGFGGAVAACRLAEKGMSVLVLERGREWTPETYPRAAGDGWIFDVDEPHKQNGWIDARFFNDMIVIQGAGVGGGSLVYANISVEAPGFIFEKGWPPEITYEKLAPHYAEVGRMLDVQELPDGQLTKRFELVRRGAEALGYGDRFKKLPLAVRFDDHWSYDLDDPFNKKHSKFEENAHGVRQGTCIHLGNCDIGCDVQAKNTLDLNYLAVARRKGAEVRPLHLVDRIEPEGTGYRVHFQRLAKGRGDAGQAVGERVVLAAGSLGSTELLFRCRDQHKTLPAISRRLGEGWSSNGDFLTPAFYDEAINPTHGPTISARIDFLDGSVSGSRFFIQDGGFPDLLNNYLGERARLGLRKPTRMARKALKRVRKRRKDDPALSGVMPWFAQGIDEADGRLFLGRSWLTPWRRKLKLHWDIGESKKVIESIITMHKRLAEETGGVPWVPPTWTAFENLATPHPLGGCNMGPDASSGVVDHAGRVFNYERLYVMDGAIVPEAIGRNPSRTIAALAERCCTLVT